MLEVDLSALIITAVVFLGMIFILNLILYKPLLKFIDDRNNSIKFDEDSVSKNTSDIGKYTSEIEKIILDARAEASARKNAAIKKAKDEAQSIILAKKQSIESQYESFEIKLKDKRAELKSELLANLPEFKTGLNGLLARI